MLCGGPDSVFVNLAAVAGPVQGKPMAMMDVNYHGALAAARACQSLHFGHFIQSSTQATAAERAGQVRQRLVALFIGIFHQSFVSSWITMFLAHMQVPYSKHKSMADFALGRIVGMPVTIASLGLLYRFVFGRCGRRFARES